MFDGIQSFSSEQIIDLLKNIATLMAILAPALKALTSTGKEKPRQLEDRHKRLQVFFENGGPEQHPLLVESAFGAAVGHTKLDAREIRLVLHQLKPTNFMNSYLRVRSYLTPNDAGNEFELRSFAANSLIRKAFISFGVLLYSVFLFAGIWLLLYSAPQLASKHSWGDLCWTVLLSISFVVIAIFCLNAASRPHWANVLYLNQVRVK